jgi:hypothetical protein
MNTKFEHIWSSCERLIFSVAFVLLLNFPVLSQPAIQWQRCLGGTGQDQGYSLIQTTDGGFAIVGFAMSNDGDCIDNHSIGTSDVFIVRLDQDGKTIWEKCLGGTKSDQAYSIVQTIDSGFIIAGHTYSNDGDVSGLHNSAANLYSDVWIVKLDKSGSIEWQHCYGGSKGEDANSIIQTDDGGYAFTGTTTSNDGDVSGYHGDRYGDIWVVKLDAGGNIQWQKCLGGSDYEVAYSIIQTSDKGYVITGLTASNDGDVSGNHNPGYYDLWVAKLNSAGNILWQHCYGGTFGEEGKQVIQTSDGGYAIAGFTNSVDGDITGFHGGNWDVWILRLNPDGTLLWEKCFGGSFNEEGMSLVQTTDGGFVFTGCCNSVDGDPAGLLHHGSDDVWLTKISSVGVIEWQELLGGSLIDFANVLIHTKDDGYALVGWTASDDQDVSGNHKESVYDIWVVKLGCIPSAASIYLKISQVNPHPGDSVDIPLYMKPESGVFTSSGVLSGTLHFLMNTDFITPVRFISTLTGLTFSNFNVTGNGVSLTLQDSTAFTLNGETLIGMLRCAAYLSDSEQTTVTLTEGTFASSNPSCATLSVNTDSLLVSLDYQCGDSILSRFLKHDTLFRILNIVPNPASQNVTISFQNNSSAIFYELFDALGVTKRKGSVEGNSLVLDVSDLSSGRYYIRALNSAGLHTTKSIEILR